MLFVTNEPIIPFRTNDVRNLLAPAFTGYARRDNAKESENEVAKVILGTLRKFKPIASLFAIGKEYRAVCENERSALNKIAAKHIVVAREPYFESCQYVDEDNEKRRSERYDFEVWLTKNTNVVIEVSTYNTPTAGTQAKRKAQSEIVRLLGSESTYGIAVVCGSERKKVMHGVNKAFADMCRQHTGGVNAKRVKKNIFVVSVDELPALLETLAKRHIRN